MRYILIKYKIEQVLPAKSMNEVAKMLDQKGKVQTGGGDLWRRLRTSKGDDLREARQLMAEYNCRDVALTEELYGLMRPWLTGINLPTYSDNDSAAGPFCPACDSERIHYRGFAYTTNRSYRRFQCADCGKWGRDTASIRSTTQVPL